MSSQYVELANRPQPLVDRSLLTAEIGWRVWGTPANFNGFRVLASLLHRRRSTEVNQTREYSQNGLYFMIYFYAAISTIVSGEL